MDKDQDNITYLADTEKVFSEHGKRFHEEKYLPKLERVKKHLSPAASKSLDIGIGYGSFIIMTQKFLNLQAHGMDPFPKSIQIAKQYTSCELRLGSIEDDSWPYDNQFDFVSCLDVVEHLAEPERFFQNVKKVLAPNAIILLTTPLRLFPYEMRSWPIIGIPDKNTTHINVQPPGFWDKLAIDYNFEILESWRGEHLTHVKYISGALKRISKFCGMDPRTTPFISAFQQAYNLILKCK